MMHLRLPLLAFCLPVAMLLSGCFGPRVRPFEPSAGVEKSGTPRLLYAHSTHALDGRQLQSYKPCGNTDDPYDRDDRDHHHALIQAPNGSGMVRLETGCLWMVPHDPTSAITAISLGEGVHVEAVTAFDDQYVAAALRAGDKVEIAFIDPSKGEVARREPLPFEPTGRITSMDFTSDRQRVLVRWRERKAWPGQDWLAVMAYPTWDVQWTTESSAENPPGLQSAEGQAFFVGDHHVVYERRRERSVVGVDLRTKSEVFVDEGVWPTPSPSGLRFFYSSDALVPHGEPRMGRVMVLDEVTPARLGPFKHLQWCDGPPGGWFRRTSAPAWSLDESTLIFAEHLGGVRWILAEDFNVEERAWTYDIERDEWTLIYDHVVPRDHSSDEVFFAPGDADRESLIRGYFVPAMNQSDLSNASP